MDPHIFADPDPDPGSQNLEDPDPKHCFKPGLLVFCHWDPHILTLDYNSQYFALY